MSGIGPAVHLKTLGIDVVDDHDQVGANLQDHLQLRMVYRTANATTLNEISNSMVGKAAIALQYALTRSGPMSMAPSQVGAFVRSDPTFETPNLQFHIQPLSLDSFGEPLHDFPAITASVCNLRPESRGHVRITSPSSSEQPEIDPNYLATSGDRKVAVDAPASHTPHHGNKGLRTL